MTNPEQNAKYIQLLNNNNIIIEKNVETLNQQIKKMEDTINGLARDSAAMQRAIIEYLKEKEIIKDEDDIRLLQKLHIKNISQLDQEIAERKGRQKDS